MANGPMLNIVVWFTFNAQQHQMIHLDSKRIEAYFISVVILAAAAA